MSDTITTVNPATDEDLAEYKAMTDDDLEVALARAWSTFSSTWSIAPVQQRVDLIRALADLLEDREDDLAGLMTAEMGKPIADSRAEVHKCAWLCRHQAEEGPGYLEGRRITLDGAVADVRYDPMGPIFAIMPWNFPLWQVFRFLAPNVVGGNTGLLKHASNVTGTALAIQQLVAEAGAPEGVFTTLVIDHDQSDQVIADPRVRGVTLTGSDVAGRHIASAAGQHLTPSVMELGGSDPFIVLDDADLDLAVRLAVDSRFLNSGQSCINAKRLIVVDSLYDDVVQALEAAVGDLLVGDPTVEETDIGPLARKDLRDTVHDQVTRTLEHHDGGRLVRGGQPIDGPGAFYEPTIIEGMSPEAPAADEEVFGPVASVLRAEGEDDAVAIANATRFGLGAAIITGDVERGQALAPRVDAGMVFINELVKSDPRLPFGGVKDSGYGRELSREGAIAFMNTKLVYTAQ